MSKTTKKRKNGTLPVQKVCDYCGEVFTACDARTQYCPDHKDPRSRSNAASRSKNPNKALFNTVKKVEEYNLKNGTCLSYGKYVSKVERKK